MDFRIEKFNNSIKKIIGESISNIEDYQDFSMISIMKVETSKDLSYCKVFVSVFNQSNSDSEQAVIILNESADNILILAKASKPLRSNLGLPGSA